MGDRGPSRGLPLVSNPPPPARTRGPGCDLGTARIGVIGPLWSHQALSRSAAWRIGGFGLSEAIDPIKKAAQEVPKIRQELAALRLTIQVALARDKSE